MQCLLTLRVFPHLSEQRRFKRSVDTLIVDTYNYGLYSMLFVNKVFMFINFYHDKALYYFKTSTKMYLNLYQKHFFIFIHVSVRVIM